MNSDIIFSVSVQQTGTWFLLNLIKRHPQVHSFQHIGNYFEEREGCCGHQFLESIVDMWFGDRIWTEQEPQNCAREVVDRLISSIASPPVGMKTLLHSHLSRGKQGKRKTTLNFASPSFHSLFLQQFMGLCRTVIPIRDPLRSLLTRQNRHPDLDHRYLVDGFEGLAKCRADVFFFPVDLFKDLESKQLLVARLFEFLELEVPEYAAEVVKSWAPANTSGHYEMKDWYDAGDVEKIRRAIPEEYRALKKSVPVTRPFLESLGYRDLIWWE